MAKQTVSQNCYERQSKKILHNDQRVDSTKDITILSLRAPHVSAPKYTKLIMARVGGNTDSCAVTGDADATGDTVTQLDGRSPRKPRTWTAPRSICN